MNKQLSIVIPARSEMFLAKTIENALENIEADTEIIAVLDGAWTDPPIQQHDRVNVIYIPEAIGQRAATNLGVKLSKARYIMKLDAHCSFDKGFDRKMIEFMKRFGDNITSIPVMRNLWAFDWVCECGERKYQDKGGTCDKCGKQMTKDIKWIGKERPQSTSYSFDSEPHFQYFREYSKRPEVRKQAQETGFTETMSLQGSCFMATRENYWKWELCDEKMGSWGNQGIEVACATWLTKHSVLVNYNTWYAHMFRTKAVNDFGFPYSISGREVQKTKQRVKDKYWNFEHPKQRKSVSWLVRRFMPIPGWDEDKINKLKQSEERNN
uniref:Putative glycosyltransferase n=1 Tax=viral metagenome TaxID=1070528 RepID=A0A6M3IQP8_9ZZZZ